MSKTRKRRQLTNKKKRLIIINVFLAVFIFLGVGYAGLSANLNIFGNITVKKYLEPTVPNSIKRYASVPTNPLACEYTGTHQDNIDASLSTETIYYWCPRNDNEAQQVLNMNNVIFADHCWQTLRTTDTSGIKMIYNGEAVDGKCLDTRGNHVGYSGATTTSLYSNYWYGTDYNYDSTNNVFNISGDTEQATWNETTGPNLVGRYTCAKTTENGTCSILYLIEAYNNSSSAYTIRLTSSSHYSQFGTIYYNRFKDSPADVGYMYNNDAYSTGIKGTLNESMTNSLDNYTYGDSYIDNGNDTYTIDNPTTINGSDWSNVFSNVGANKYVCKNAVNDVCSELWYTTETTSTTMTYIDARPVKYGSSFMYNNSTNTYTLSGNQEYINTIDSSYTTKISNAHYTCWNSTGQCSKLSFVYYTQGIKPNYINLTNGKSVDDALNEMFYNNDVNAKNSTIKKGIDAWYEKYLLGYTRYLEDIIFCNDRSQSSNTNGWHSNGSITQQLYFGGSAYLSCSNVTDRFSVANEKARLTYPVGLITNREKSMMSSSIMATGKKYWTMSPGYFGVTGVNDIYRFAYVTFENETGSGYSNGSAANTYGLRPVISLKSDTEYISGDGSQETPYIVDISGNNG